MMARFKGEKEVEDSPAHEAMPGDMAEDAKEGYASGPRKKLMKKLAEKRGKKGAVKRGKRKRSKKVVKKNSKKKRTMRGRSLADELNAFTGRDSNQV